MEGEDLVSQASYNKLVSGGGFWFSESEIAGGEAGVHLTFSREGRASGEAFVEFASEEDLERGLEKHNEHMGQRYIEGGFFVLYEIKY